MAKTKAKAGAKAAGGRPKKAGAPPLRLEWLDPDSLSDNPANWRSHPPQQTDALRDVIAEVGWAGALLYNERTRRLIDGHARKALFQGKGAVPVLVGSWTEEQERLILATLDPLAALAGADSGRLNTLLKEVVTGSESLQGMLAEMAGKANAAQTIPEIAPQAEPVMASECFVEIRCTRAALGVMRPSLEEWSRRDDCTVDIS